MRALFSRLAAGKTGAPCEAGQDAADFRDLLEGFESLGDVCEFAALQRAHGIERPTLFGWRSTSLPLLAGLIEGGLEGLDDADALELEIHQANPAFRAEYMLVHRRLGLHSHTFKLVGDMPADWVLRREHRQLVLLKRKFLEDLRTARRIFVFRSLHSTPPDDAERLSRALRRTSPNELLWVRVAGEGRAPGEVARLAPGLIGGWMDALAPYEDGATCPGTAWPAVLTGARALARQVPLPRMMRA